MQVTALNKSQKLIIQAFAGARSEQEAEDIANILRNYYFEKLEEELHRLDQDGILDRTALEALSNEHNRTQYSAKERQ